MIELYPQIEPYEHGMLDVDDGQLVYWETCGNPQGEPALVLHGGPGSGCSPGWRRYFHPEKYRMVLFDQRNCGRSTPSASDPVIDLSTNTTQHLIADIDKLREHLGIDKWLLFGGSWGTTLALAYAQQHPQRVSRLVLFSVTNTTHREVEWITREMGRIFPAEWTRFRDGAAKAIRPGHTGANLAAAYCRLLHDPDPGVRQQAARDWCAWQDTHVATHPNHRPDERYTDPEFRMTFARLVTHYWANAAFLREGQLIDEAGKLAGIPGVLVHGRLDISSPVEVPWRLAKAWPDAKLILVDEAGHGAGHSSMTEVLVQELNS